MTDHRTVFEECANQLNSELEHCDDLFAMIREKVSLGTSAGSLEGAALALKWFEEHPGIAQRIAMAVVIGTIAREHLAEESE